MMLGKFLLTIGAAFFCVALNAAESSPKKADFAVSQKLKDIWSDPVLNSRIDAGIKTNRMGDFYLEFDSDVSDVKIEQISHDFKFGAYASRVITEGVPDTKYTKEQIEDYARLYKRLFNAGTISVCWNRIEPVEGVYRWDYSNDAVIPESTKTNPTVLQPDIALAFCESNGLEVKGHNLFWAVNGGFFFPDYAKNLGNRDLLEKYAMRNVRAVIAKYGDRIRVWDVINEPCTYRPVEGADWFPDYAFKVFKEAERLLPVTDTFIINETFGAWGQYLQWEEEGSFYLLTKSLIARGAKVDGIGLQFHLFDKREWKRILDGNFMTPKQMKKVLDGYSKLGRTLHISEITIPDYDNEENQAFFARNVYRFWFSHPNVGSIVWWNLRDGQAAPGEVKFKGGLVKSDCTPKAAYRELEKLITHDWHTSLSFDGSRRSIHFEGFYGAYEISFKYGGTEFKRRVWCIKNADNTIRIRLPKKSK